MKLLLISFLLILLPSFALSGQKDIDAPPYFSNIGAIGSNSGLSMECKGEAPYKEIDCSFVQMFIRATSAEDISKNRNNFINEIDKLKPNEIEKHRKDFDIAKLAEIEASSRNNTMEQNRVLNEMFEIIKRISVTKDKASYKKEMIDLVNISDSTCHISSYSFDLQFTRIAKNKWISNPGPQGLCNVVKVATLENTPEHPILWTFSQITASADVDKFCNIAKVGDGIVFKWDAPKLYKFDQCKYLEFGAF